MLMKPVYREVTALLALGADTLPLDAETLNAVSTLFPDLDWEDERGVVRHLTSPLAG